MINSYLEVNSYLDYLFDNDANIGQARRSPTIKAEDKIPS